MSKAGCLQNARFHKFKLRNISRLAHYRADKLDGGDAVFAAFVCLSCGCGEGIGAFRNPENHGKASVSHYHDTGEYIDMGFWRIIALCALGFIHDVGMDAREIDARDRDDNRTPCLY